MMFWLALPAFCENTSAGLLKMAKTESQNGKALEGSGDMW